MTELIVECKGVEYSIQILVITSSCVMVLIRLCHVSIAGCVFSFVESVVKGDTYIGVGAMLVLDKNDDRYSLQAMLSIGFFSIAVYNISLN